MLKNKSNHSNDHISNDKEIMKTFELLSEGKKKIQLMDRKDVVLIWGITGAGKTTFVQWIAGDNMNLLATETTSGTGEYIIEDTDNKIGKVTTESETIFPELFVDVSTNATYYDFPGFSDTRSTSHDIATAYFIRAVVDHVEHVKILFLIGHHSVKIGLDRQSFPELVRNAVDLIKDIEKFSASIGLAVTKVDNAYVNRGRTLVSNEITIRGIANFLSEYKTSLENELSLTKAIENQYEVLRKSIKFVDILLTFKENTYPRIVIFRRPDEAGPLSKIDLMQNGKKIVQKMLQKELKFTKVQKNDFGYTISHKSKLDIFSLTSVINEKISNDVNNVTNDIREEFRRLGSNISQKMKVSVQNLPTHLNVSEAQEFNSKIVESHRILSETVTNVKVLQNITDFPKVIEEAIQTLQCNSCRDLMGDVSDQVSYFDFLETVSNVKLSFRCSEWAASFQASLMQLTDDIYKVQMNAKDLAVKLNEKISAEIDQIATKIQEHFQVTVDSMRSRIKTFPDSLSSHDANIFEAENFHAELVDGYDLLTQLTEESKNLSGIGMLGQKLTVTLDNLQISGTEEKIDIVNQNIKSVEFLQFASNSELSLANTLWTTLFNSTVAYSSLNLIEEDAERVEGQVKANIERDLSKFVKEVGLVTKSMLSTMNISTTRDKIEMWEKIVSAKIKSFVPTCDVVFEVKALYSEMQITSTGIKNVEQNIMRQVNFLIFLNTIRGIEKASIANSFSWKTKLIDLDNDIRSFARWYTFINGISEKLSNYTNQQFIKTYDHLSFGFFENRKLRNNFLTGDNFDDFLTKVRQFEIDGLDDMSGHIPSIWQLKDMNALLKTTIGTEPNIKCLHNDKIIVDGSFVRFSYFLDNDFYLKCLRDMEVKSVHVYATIAVFIDRDFTRAGAKINLIIMAPRCEVIGTKRRICLDGADAVEHKEKKAAPGVFPGTDGTDGLPGLPGGASGSFFGIVGFFVKSSALEITANGGRGGFGQDGGDGSDGVKGVDAPDVNTYCEVAHGFEIVKKTTSARIPAVFYYGLASPEIFHMKVLGTKSGPGGNAGSCGLGASGGMAGEINIIQFSELSNISMSRMAGNNGRSGNAGKVGRGAKRGNDMIISCGQSGFDKIRYDRGIVQESVEYSEDGLASVECNQFGLITPENRSSIQHPDMIINEYKSFMLKNFENRFKRDHIDSFYSKMLSHTGIKAMYNTIGLVDELMGLMEHCRTLPKSKMINFFQLHLENLEEYAQIMKEYENNLEHKKVLSYLYTATLSKMQNLENNSENDLIIDISGYLDVASNEVKTLEIFNQDDNRVGLIDRHKADHLSSIKRKIVQANDLIKHQIRPEIDLIKLDIREQIHLLVSRNEDLKTSARRKVVYALEAKREIVNSFATAIFLGAMKTLCQGLEFLGPVGIAANQIVGGGTAVLQSLRFGAKLSMPVQSKDIYEQMSTFGQTSLDTLNQYDTDIEKLAKVIKIVDEAKENVKKIEDHGEKIHNTFISIIRNMGNELLKATDNLGSQSQVELDISKWQVQAKLRDIKLKMKQFIREFTAEDQLMRLVEKLDEVMTTMIDVFDRIESFREKQKFANYMADLNSAAAKRIIVTDEALSNAVRRLEIVTRTNVIISQYNSVLSALKQWVFPFADDYLKDFKLLSYPKEDKPDTQLLVQSAALSQILKMKTKVQLYGLLIRAYDKDIFESKFYSRYVSMRPFFIWKQENHREMIRKLLSGQSVVIKADVLQSAIDKDAIKFDFIEINFKSSNLSVQAEIDREVLKFGVQMKHLGNSYYRYNNKFYVLHSESQSIQYSFEKKADGKAVSSNLVYQKLLSGNVMLSPYAMWEIKLRPTSNAVSFNALKTFYNKVDLALEGRGRYVKAGSSHYSLDEYYKVDDSV